MSNTSDKQALFHYVLRLGDSSLILSQRLCQWCARAPTIEEDVALLNVALDLLGQARSLLSYAGEIEGKGRSEDDLAYFRDGRDWLNPLLVEQPNGDFAHTIVRQFLFDAFNLELYQALCRSQDQRLAAIAAKAVKEIRYHRRHSAGWLIRLGDGTDESRRRTQTALAALWPFSDELFEMPAAEQHLVDAGIAVELSTLRPAWDEIVTATLREATLALPPADQVWMQSGGKRGLHSEGFGYLLAEMQSLARAYPAARW